MSKDRAYRTIMNWIGCRIDDAMMILDGVWAVRGDNYSAQIVEEDYVEIYRNGFLIHRIFVF